jgi:hypothetical protein
MSASELKDRRGRGRQKSHVDREVEIRAVRHLVIFLLRHQFVMPESPIGDVALQLIRVRRASAELVAVLAAPARERADAGRAFVAHHVVGIIAILRLPGFVHHAGQTQPRAEVEQHGLERPDVAIQWHDRPTNGIARPVRVTDGTFEQADAVVAFQIGGVRQHQIGIRHRLGKVGVGIDDERNLVFAAFVSVGEHGDGLAGVHRRIPRHVRHVEKQCVDPIRIASGGVRDDGVQQPVRRERRLPGESLVDALGRAVGIAQQVLRIGHEAERPAGKRCVGTSAAFAGGLGSGRRRLRVGRLEAKSARDVHGAKQHLQQMDGAANVEAVRMGRDAAHGMHRDRASAHTLVVHPMAIGRRDRKLDCLLERHLGELSRNPPDGGGRDAAARGDRIGCIGLVEIALRNERKDRHARAPVDHMAAGEGRTDIGRAGVHRAPGNAIPSQRRACAIAQHESIVRGAGFADDQDRRIGMGYQIIEVDAAG